MKRKVFILGLLAIFSAGVVFWSCQKEEILDDELMLKKASVMTVGDDLNWDGTVCAGEDHEFCLTFPQATKGNGDLQSTNGQVQLLIDGDDPETTDEIETEYWIQIAHGGGNTGFCFNYTFETAGTYNLQFKASDSKWSEATVTVENCGCETSFSGITECGTFGDDDQYNRKVVFTFKTELEGEYKIQGGLTNFTGEEFEVNVTGGEYDTRVPGGSSNRIITATGSLAECGEVVVTVLWNSDNSGDYIIGDWSVELDGEKILVLEKLLCDDEGEGYEPITEEE